MMLRQSSPSITSRLGNRRGARGSGDSTSLQKILVLLVGIIAASCLALTWFLLGNGDGAAGGGMRASTRTRKKLPIPSVDNSHNAVAMDIINSLSCDSLADEDASGGLAEKNVARRLEEVALGEDAQDGERQDWLMDDLGGVGDVGDPLYASKNQVNAKHLMCLVAGATKLPSHITKDSFHCDALGTRREALLDVWASARSQMRLEVIQMSLGFAVESQKTIVNKPLNIWTPWNDVSTDYLETVLNDENSGIWSLDSVLGPGSLFVDIGSGLGLSSLAAALLYPKATVLSVEPASPSWLLSRINIVCNLPPDSKLPNPVLAGVGQKNDGMGKMMWRPSSTGATRAWTPKSEHKDDDVELVVRLRTLRSILAEAAAEEDLEADPPVSVVLNVDCEGCEYNLIPALTKGEYGAIDTFIGTTGVHWGYIPDKKRPSSKRGAETHERLCRHYDFARQSIECCAFPDAKVKRPGSTEKLTVKEVSGDLCAGFDDWAKRNKLYESTDDYGWMDLSSMSDV